MLTTEQRAALAAHIAATPELAAMMPDHPGHVATALNAKTTTMIRESRFTALALADAIGMEDAGEFLAAVEFYAGQQRGAKGQISTTLRDGAYWANKALSSAVGVDIGNADTRTLVGAMVALGKISKQIADKVLALGVHPASWAEVQFGADTVLTFDDVNKAMGRP